METSRRLGHRLVAGTAPVDSLSVVAAEEVHRLNLVNRSLAEILGILLNCGRCHGSFGAATVVVKLKYHPDRYMTEKMG